METKPFFAKFKPSELQLLISTSRSTKGLPFEFELETRLVQEMGSSKEGFKNPMTKTNTPKFVKEIVAEVMQTQKAVKVFQTMAIINLNMGNLNLEVNNLKNRLIK